ncbi:hypothetical protein BBJ28_00006519 [Nothophytophthora sp. Chile5]|nr:hypothetical protein BBJ28_00006519 [Nothophytophthora sp. Chile5]
MLSCRCSSSCLPLLLLCLALVLRLASGRRSASRPESPLTLKTLFTRSKYHHHASLDHYYSPLGFLAAFDLGQDGTFEISLDIKLNLDTSGDVEGRVMLHLLACDEAAEEIIQSMVDSSTNNTDAPSYCAIPNRTLAYYCQSFPLENESTDQFAYQTSKTVIGSTGNGTTQSEYDKLVDASSGVFSFYIDACEVVGGQVGILRSCLDNPPSVFTTNPTAEDDRSCFYCPKNYPNRTAAEDERSSEECVIPPALNRALDGEVAMNLCTASGECFHQPNRGLVWFYAASIAVWSVSYLLWICHLHTAKAGTVVELHHRLKLVPISQLIYSTLAFVAIYTDGVFIGLERGVLPLIAIIAQVIALALSVEVALLIATGWKITQTTLRSKEMLGIRVVVTLWAVSFVLLKQLHEEHAVVIVAWALSWTAIVFATFYCSATNMAMLRKRLIIGARHDLDLMAVARKWAGFLYFQRLLKSYVFLAIMTALMGGTDQWLIWRWVSVQGHEVLTFLFYFVLGYIFRCQQFRFQVRDNLTIDVDPDESATVTATLASNANPNGAVVTPALETATRVRIATIVLLMPSQTLFLGTAYSLEDPDVTPSTEESEEQPTCTASVRIRVAIDAPSDATESETDRQNSG